MEIYEMDIAERFEILTHISEIYTMTLKEFALFIKWMWSRDLLVHYMSV